MLSVGEFHKVYDPSVGEAEPWYINDHTFVREPSGIWRLFGITHAEPANPLDEITLAHATAPDVTGPWTKAALAMTADPAAGETHLWAPHVIAHEGGWWMVYCAGGASHEAYRIHVASSPDLVTWTRHGANPLIVDGFDARDPMLLRLGDGWVLYYTATSEPAGGHHVVKAAASRDLVAWSQPREVFRDPAIGTYGGPTESPFVVERAGHYFLFVCTNRNYVETAVYVSDDPWSWRLDQRAATFPAHAAEVVAAPDGRWWVSHCGWGQGGVWLAELTWET